jgi:hypothetical protein
MTNAVFLDVTPCGSCKIRRSEELSASMIRVTIIGELGVVAAIPRLFFSFITVGYGLHRKHLPSVAGYGPPPGCSATGLHSTVYLIMC